MQPNNQEPADMPIDASDSPRLIQGIRKLWQWLPRWSRLPLLLLVLAFAPLFVRQEILAQLSGFRAGDAALFVWVAMLVCVALLEAIYTLIWLRPTWDRQRHMYLDREQRPVCQRCWAKEKMLVPLPTTDERYWHCRVCNTSHKNTEWKMPAIPKGPALRVGAGHEILSSRRNSFLKD